MLRVIYCVVLRFTGSFYDFDGHVGVVRAYEQDLSSRVKERARCTLLNEQL